MGFNRIEPPAYRDQLPHRSPPHPDRLASRFRHPVDKERHLDQEVEHLKHEIKVLRSDLENSRHQYSKVERQVLQDLKEKWVAVQLLDGSFLEGWLIDSDKYSLYLKCKGCPYLIMKAAFSYIRPGPPPTLPL